MLLGHAEVVARAWGYEAVYLKVRVSNEAAVRLYSSVGYEIVQEEEETGIATMRKDFGLRVEEEEAGGDEGA
jgi:ribosomal protein S18 acetylase RimI-like enzyme